jgi:hypothetical protein
MERTRAVKLEEAAIADQQQSKDKTLERPPSVAPPWSEVKTRQQLFCRLRDIIGK